MQNTNQKLITISKIMFSTMRVLFIILIFMAIFPWVSPTSGISEFLLSMQGIFSIIQSNHKNIYLFMSTLTPLSRVFGLTGSLFTLLPLLLGTIIMIKLSKNYSKELVFNLDNTRSYRKLGIIYLLSAILLQPLSQALFTLSVTINNPIGQRSIAFGVDINNLTTIFFALVLIVIAQIMNTAQKINEERELTI